MQLSLVAVLAGLAASTMAQRPANISICDYYTTALLKDNTPANQLALLTLLVNTAVIGNYTQPSNGVLVPGILNPHGSYNGTPVNLLPYFNGGLASTNMGGSAGVAMNFLDGGGAVPLTMNLPAFANATASNQYGLLTHLYQYFGVLLGCSGVGMGAYPAYQGGASMYDVHKFMVLSSAENGYFITQVALSAASFGVAASDIAAAGTALGGLFNNRCGAPQVVIPADGPVLESVCTDYANCPLAANSSCANQPQIPQPFVANVALAMGEGINMTSTAAAAGTAAATGAATAMASGASTAAAAPAATKAAAASKEVVASAGALALAALAVFAL